MINEVCTEGCSSTTSSGSNDEFVELYNAGSEVCPLEGYQVFNVSSNDTGFGTSWWTGKATDNLAPGHFFLLVGQGWKGTSQYNFKTTSGLLGADGGVGLIAPGGKASDDPVDGVVWKAAKATNNYCEGSPLEKLSPNKSASRFPDGTDTDQNTLDFKSPTKPTPGAPNVAQ